MARKALGKKVRFEVFKRDGFKCQYCGATPITGALQVDHIIPVVEGGGNDLDNLITSCQPCNIGKGATPLSDVPQTLAARAAEVAEREEQISAYNDVMRGRRERVEDESWDVADIFITQFRRTDILKADFESIRVFIEKIGLHDCLLAMQRAVAKKPYSEKQAFKYFCGICWNIVRGGPKNG